jgi:cytochrome bd ubiquinol oxidase subunit II
MLVMHGATYLQIRTEGVIEQRARTAAKMAGVALIALFALSGVWAAFGLSGYRITTMPAAGSAFAPLAKTVAVAPGGWLANYAMYPWMAIAPIAAFAGAGGAILFSGGGRARLAFLCSAASVAGVILTAGFAMFPFVMPSSTDPNSSLTAWDAVSSHRTLGIMFWVVVLMLPVVIAYTAWVFRVLRGKITVEHIRETTHTSY